MKLSPSLFAIFLFTNSTLAYSLSEYQVPNSRSYTIENGLSQSTVYNITEDLDGYIWIGTQRGIERFDGNNFINFDQNDDHKKGLQGASVNDLHVDYITGHLWIATINGLSSLNTQSFEFASHAIEDTQGNEDNIITAIFQDTNGVLWIGTQKGLYRRTGDDKFVSETQVEEAIFINDIDELDDGKLVIAASDGVKLYDTALKAWTNEYLSDKRISTLLVTEQDNIWAGTNGNGVFNITSTNADEPRIEQYTSDKGLSDNLINDIVQVSDGSIWVATSNGISIFPSESNASIVNYANVTDSVQSNQARSNNILSLFNSSTNNIFYGTLSIGFSILDPKSILFDKVIIDNQAISYSVAIDNEQALWIVNELGLYKFNSNLEATGPFPTATDKLNSINKITALLFDKNTDTLWTASRDGLSRLNVKRDAIEMVAFSTQHVYSMSIDDNGFLWVGTASEGLYQYDPAKNEIVRHWPMPMVLRTILTADNKAWIATIGGLYLLNMKTHEITLYRSDENKPNSLPYDVVTWISQISPSKFLVGTQSKGLVHMTHEDFGDEPYFEQLFVDSKLAKLAIGAVVEDANNNYWITTTEGIAKSNASFSKIEFFDGNDGANASGYFIGAYAVDKKDQIYFPGPQGLTFFHPNDINNSATAPKLKFTKVSTLSNTEQEMSVVSSNQLSTFSNKEQTLLLSPNNLAIDIEFSALEFGSPKTIKYAYILKGFHTTWQNTDSLNRSISFTNLNSGKYQFIVKSTNRYGQWANNDITLTIIVETPWWQTTLAIVSFGLLVLIIFYLLYRWRTYSLHRTSIRLAEMVDAKTKDLEAANVKLKTLINLDPLTNAYNRRGFKEFAVQEYSMYQRSNKVFSIVLLDVDNFKQINDKYGHDIGDEAIIFIVKQLKAILRAHDILARWGGEEFIILLPSATKYEALITAEKLRQSIESSILDIQDHKISTTISGGVAQVGQYDSLETCIKKADEFLYLAKHDGRNRIKG